MAFIASGLAAAITSAATSIGIGATAASAIGAIGSGAIIGSGVGAAGAAIAGKDPGMGALMGAATGFAGGALGAVAGAAGGAAGGAATTGADVAANTTPAIANTTTQGITDATTQGVANTTQAVTNTTGQAVGGAAGGGSSGGTGSALGDIVGGASNAIPSGGGGSAQQAAPPPQSTMDQLYGPDGGSGVQQPDTGNPQSQSVFDQVYGQNSGTDPEVGKQVGFTDAVNTQPGSDNSLFQQFGGGGNQPSNFSQPDNSLLPPINKTSQDSNNGLIGGVMDWANKNPFLASSAVTAAGKGLASAFTPNELQARQKLAQQQRQYQLEDYARMIQNQNVGPMTVTPNMASQPTIKSPASGLIGGRIA